jgi:methionine-rich copper-binding protein CopC
VSSTPADGASLAKAPASVVLKFDEPVGRKFGAVVVTGPGGERVQAGALRVEGVRAIQALRPLRAAGLYHVGWRVVSADGHPVSGRLTFTLRAGAAAPAGARTATPTPTHSGAAVGTPASSSGRGGAWLVAAAAAGLAVILGVGLGFVRRSRARAFGDGAREPSDGD